MANHHFSFTDVQFERLQSLLPNKPRGVPRDRIGEMQRDHRHAFPIADHDIAGADGDVQPSAVSRTAQDRIDLRKPGGAAQQVLLG